MVVIRWLVAVIAVTSLAGETAPFAFGQQGVKNRWRVTAQIKADQSSIKNVLVTLPVPTDWPEQYVALSQEDIPPEVQSVKYRDLDSGVRQLVAVIPRIGANQLVTISLTFDVTTHRIAAPDNTDSFRIPQRVPKEFRVYLGVSPGISYRHAKLREQAKGLISEHRSDWLRVEALYNWVRDNIEYRSQPASDSLTVFRNRAGGSEDHVLLFVAMCRAVNVPARVVWVDGTQYAEFYLVDSAGDGHWFPCNLIGHREFGSLSEPRIILQKGDNIRVPEKEDPQLFCTSFVSAAGRIMPIVEFSEERIKPH